jgi:hypothetical protein
MIRLTLTVLKGVLAVVRLPAGAGLPFWAVTSDFLSFTRSKDESSLVCEARCIPAGERAERGFSALRVDGTLPFEATGVLLSLADPLARSGIPIFVVSTYETDYVLLQESVLPQAIAALRAAGHSVTE